jgi:hypothetical protein
MEEITGGFRNWYNEELHYFNVARYLSNERE